MRIYPSHLPVVPNEPQAEDFSVIEVSSACGEGLIALRRFVAGALLFRMNGISRETITQYTLQVGPNQHIDDPYVAGKVLHSCEPNSMLDVSTHEYLATRDIEEGELLTMDYDLTEDYLFQPFDCQCGAPNCRGRIAGRLSNARIPISAI